MNSEPRILHLTTQAQRVAMAQQQQQQPGAAARGGGGGGGGAGGMGAGIQPGQQGQNMTDEQIKKVRAYHHV